MTLNIGELRSVGGEGTPPPVGEVVGKYRLIRDLGIGGMARVSLATLEGPAGFSKRYVVKRILPEFARNPQFARMFANEARVAAMLDHPNIVRVFEFDRENGTYYLVMEYVDGASLDQIVRAARKGGVPLGPDFAVEVGLPLARALAYAHSLKLPDGRPLNLVHRDVSPGNVLISRDGVVKLTDFGVVKSTITTTVAGAVKGKLSYMSPEQITVQNVDHRSDLFSLGVVLYEVATGLRLFRGDSLGATAVRVMRAVVPPPRSVMPETDPRLEAILMKLLERDPRARYQSAAELATDLEGYRASGAGDKRSIPVTRHREPAVPVGQPHRDGALAGQHGQRHRRRSRSTRRASTVESPRRARRRRRARRAAAVHARRRPAAARVFRRRVTWRPTPLPAQVSRTRSRASVGVRARADRRRRASR